MKALRRKSMDKGLRDNVLRRAGGMCDRCTTWLEGTEWHCHHRKLRSRGGEDSMANLVALCEPCHSWAHGNPKAAEADGWICPSWADPAEWLVNLYQFGRFAIPGDEWRYGWKENDSPTTETETTTDDFPF